MSLPRFDDELRDLFAATVSAHTATAVAEPPLAGEGAPDPFDAGEPAEMEAAGSGGTADALEDGGAGSLTRTPPAGEPLGGLPLGLRWVEPPAAATPADATAAPPEPAVAFTTGGSTTTAPRSAPAPTVRDRGRRRATTRRSARPTPRVARPGLPVPPAPRPTSVDRGVQAPVSGDMKTHRHAPAHDSSLLSTLFFAGVGVLRKLLAGGSDA
ncbi:MAG: hypothetical protein HYZ53_01710 [Planctomycetes bacterium]|nr:hypothetical protein [Planctomycetota bacterium]